MSASLNGVRTIPPGEFSPTKLDFRALNQSFYQLKYFFPIRYKSLPTNCKNIEATYAKLEVKREILAVAEACEERITSKTDRVNGVSIVKS